MMKYVFILFLLVSFGLNAQEPEKILIRAGKLFDPESGQFKTGMSVLVNKNKIESVKPEKEVTAAEKKNYTLIDLSRYTVLPGLIDAHTHLLNREVLHPGNELPGLDMGSVEEITAIVQEAHRYHIRVTAHSTDNDAVYNAVVGGVDGIEHGYQVNDTTLELMAKRGVHYTERYLNLYQMRILFSGATYI